MTYRVVIGPGAEANIRESYRYLVQQRSPAAAERWRIGLFAAIRRLETFPRSGPLADEAEDFGIELREVLFGKRSNVIRVVHTIRDDVVSILHVRHSGLGPIER